MRSWHMLRSPLIEGALAGSVIGAFFEVYNELGFGLLEQVYVRALEVELRLRGHHVGREVGVAVHYKGVEVGAQRLDMLVDGRLVVEAKSTHGIHSAATRQLYNYLRATNLDVGLLLHFGPRPRFYRIVCQHARRRRATRSNVPHPPDSPHASHPAVPNVEPRVERGHPDVNDHR